MNHCEYHSNNALSVQNDEHTGVYSTETRRAMDLLLVFRGSCLLDVAPRYNLLHSATVSPNCVPASPHQAAADLSCITASTGGLVHWQTRIATHFMHSV